MNMKMGQVTEGQKIGSQYNDKNDHHNLQINIQMLCE